MNAMDPDKTATISDKEIDAITGVEEETEEVENKPTPKKESFMSLQDAISEYNERNGTKITSEELRQKIVEIIKPIVLKKGKLPTGIKVLDTPTSQKITCDKGNCDTPLRSTKFTIGRTKSSVRLTISHLLLHTVRNHPQSELSADGDVTIDPKILLEVLFGKKKAKKKASKKKKTRQRK